MSKRTPPWPVPSRGTAFGTVPGHDGGIAPPEGYPTTPPWVVPSAPERPVGPVVLATIGGLIAGLVVGVIGGFMIAYEQPEHLRVDDHVDDAIPQDSTGEFSDELTREYGDEALEDSEDLFGDDSSMSEASPNEYGPGGVTASLQPGMCATGLGLTDVGIVVTPCDQPHVHEVFSRRAILGGGGDPYPRPPDVQTLGENYCEIRFGLYVGTPFHLSSLMLEAAVPDPAAWEAGERDVVCALRRGDGEPLVGTAQDSRL